MSDEAALLRAIIDNPADEAVRLVYADWLEDHERTPQAEFIRTQVRRAALPPWHVEYDELRRRERQLIEQHGETWLEPVRPWLHHGFTTRRDDHEFGVFRRGFVETVLADPTRFLADPDGLFAAAPVTGLVVWIKSAALESLLASEHLGRVERLRFFSSVSRHCKPSERYVYLQQGDFHRIATCPHLSRLRELDLSGQRVPAAEVAALVRSRWLGNLETLKLNGNCVDPDGFDAIGTHLTLPALRHLHLFGHPTWARLRTWHGRPWLSGLRSLDLGACGATSEAVALLESTRWPELVSLSLAGLFGPSSTGTLAQLAERLSRLAHLNLRGWSLGLQDALNGGRFDALESLDLSMGHQPLDVTALLTTAFPTLRVLNVRNNNLAEGLPAFARSAAAMALHSLDVQNCAASLNEYLEFARTARLPNLQTLALGDDERPFTPRFVRVLGEAEGFPALRSLTLALPGSVKFYEALAAAPLLRQLQHLRICGGIISPKVVALLTTAPGFQSLPSLEFFNSSINKDNYRRLKEHFGVRLVN
jgi:uncharacterized protein (TIGR02996 family)